MKTNINKTNILITDIELLRKYWSIGRVLGLLSCSFRHTFCKHCYQIFSTSIFLTGLLTTVWSCTSLILVFKIKFSQLFLFYSKTILVISFNYQVLLAILQRKNVDKHLRTKLIKINRKLEYDVNFDTNIISQLGKILIFHLLYIFHAVTLISVYIEIHPYILNFIQTCVYILMVLYQIYYIVFVICYICNWLKKRYIVFNRRLKLLKQFQRSERDKQRTILLMKEVYRLLNEAVCLFNSFFGKFILHISLLGFFYFLDAIHLMLYYGFMSWKIYLNIPVAVIYLVSKNSIVQLKFNTFQMIN